MRKKILFFTITLLFFSILVFSIATVRTQKTPPDTIKIKIEGAKMTPVTFSHGTHAKHIDCAVCHHKDKDPKEPGKCTICHQIKEIKEKALPATDAFHKQCQACHKENKKGGISTPTACNECHKK